MISNFQKLISKRSTKVLTTLAVVSQGKWVPLLILCFTIRCSREPVPRVPANRGQVHERILSLIASSPFEHEGRLSGQGFESFPSAGQSDGGFLKTFSQLETIFDKRAMAVEDHYLIGLLRLAGGNLEEALASLQKAVVLEPELARYHNDLAVVHLRKAINEGEAYDFFRALAHIEKALVYEPNLSEALFNKALLLEKLYLHREAGEAWNDFLACDGDSDWSVEAAAHASQLFHDPSPKLSWNEDELERSLDRRDERAIRAFVIGHAKKTRGYAEGTLLPRWASSFLDGRNRSAQASLDRLRRLGRSLKGHNGTPLVWAVVRQIDRFETSGATDSLHAMAQAFLLYEQGLAALKREALQEAGAFFLESATRFQRVGCPFEGWAKIQLAETRFYQSRYSETVEILASLEAEGMANEFPAMAGRLHWILSVAAGFAWEEGLSWESALQALHHYERTLEWDNRATANIVVAEKCDLMGRPPEAWQYRHQALASLRETADPIVGYRIAAVAGVASFLERNPEIAAYFMSEAIGYAQALEVPEYIVSVRAWQARFLGEAGYGSAAKEQLSLAMPVMAHIVSGEARARAEGEVAFAEAVLAGDLDPWRAIDLLEQAVDRFERASIPYHLTDIYLNRARFHLNAGDVAASESDLFSAIHQLETRRETHRVGRDRVSFLDFHLNAYEAMVQFQIENRTDPLTALAFTELSRSRFLADRLCEGMDHGFAMGDFEREWHRLHEILETRSVTMIAYYLLDEEIYAWVMDPLGVQLATLPASVWEVTHAVAEFDRGRRNGLPFAQLQTHLESLHFYLIEPLRAFLDASSDLVLVPHGLLQRIPFAALFDGATGRFLVEDRALLAVPGIEVFKRASERADRLAEDPDRCLLALGNPTFDRRVFSNLPDLDFAERETRDIARFYACNKVLVREEATKTAFLENVGRCQVVHLASHAIPDLHEWGGSQLVLADSAVSTKEILAEQTVYPFPKTQLAVLAACRTGIGVDSRSEGAVGLAYPFLAAGIPLVVATLWDVDDRGTYRLSTELHRNLALGMNGMQALRQAQLSLLREGNGENIADWAGFVALGGLPGPNRAR